MMRLFTLVPAALAILLAGCSSPTPDDLLARAGSEEESARAAAETVQEASERPALFADALGLYREIGREYPDSPAAEMALFRIAAILNNDIRDFPQAVGVYKEYMRKYPDGQKTAIASFLVGYIYHNEMGKLDSAEAAYRAFLDKYPNHELAISAQFELSSLGKSPEEMLPPEKDPVAAAPAGKKRL